jgi:hypothetical protein
MIEPSVMMLTVVAPPVLLFFMLFPTFLEVRRPQDAGPRLIMIDSRETSLFSRTSELDNIEENYELEFLLLPLVSEILDFLPGCESI